MSRYTAQVANPSQSSVMCAERVARVNNTFRVAFRSPYAQHAVRDEHDSPRLHVFARTDVPDGLGSVELPAGDGPRIDEEPRFWVVEPGLRVVALSERGRRGIRVEKFASYEHRPALVVDEINRVDFECDVGCRLFDDIARPGSHCE